MVTGPECQVILECIFRSSRVVSCPKQYVIIRFCSFFRYPIVFPRDKCTGDLGDQPGVRSYGLRPADERYDVYCYIDGLKGEKTLSSFNMKVQRHTCNVILSLCPIEQHYPTFSTAEFPVIPVLYPLPRNSNQGKHCLLLFWLHNAAIRL